MAQDGSQRRADELYEQMSALLKFSNIFSPPPELQDLRDAQDARRADRREERQLRRDNRLHRPRGVEAGEGEMLFQPDGSNRRQAVANPFLPPKEDGGMSAGRMLGYGAAGLGSAALAYKAPALVRSLARRIASRAV